VFANVSQIFSNVEKKNSNLIADIGKYSNTYHHSNANGHHKQKNVLLFLCFWCLMAMFIMLELKISDALLSNISKCIFFRLFLAAFGTGSNLKQF